MDILKPKLKVDSLQKINLEYFRKLAMQGIIIDLDNTIVPWDVDKISKEADSFLKRALSLDYKICLLSNARKKRTENVASQYQIEYLSSAFKPRKKAFLMALERIGLNADQALVIGDQVFTDILGGNRAGCFTILVPALSKKEFAGTKILRFFESLLTIGDPGQK